MIKNSFFIIILFLTFLSCKTDNVNGIIIGEDEFVKLVKQFPDEEKKFQGLIDVGLEYGDNDYDGVMDDKKFEQEFPKLYEYLNGK